MGLPALALVQSGWTGSIAVTYGGITTTVTPERRESYASLFARVAHAVYVDSGLSLHIESVAADQIRVVGSAAFDLTLTGNCAERTDFEAGPYTAITDQLSDANTPEGHHFPLHGQRLEGALLTSPAGTATSGGTYGHTTPQGLGRTTLRAWAPVGGATPAANAWTIETITGVYDVWCDGRILGRVRIDGWQRSPMGMRRSDYCELVADVQGVVE